MHCPLPSPQGWPLFQLLLIDLFTFLSPFLRNADLGKATQLLYKVCVCVCMMCACMCVYACADAMMLCSSALPSSAGHAAGAAGSAA